MSEGADLGGLSREELVALVVELRGTVAQLRAELAEVEAELAGRGGKAAPKGMPGLKPAPAKASAEKKPRKKRARGYARRREEPTERVEHALDTCPDCGTALVGGSPKWRRQVVEIPVAPVRVIEHVFIERMCPLCREGRTPKAELAGVVAGPRQRLGVALVSTIVTLREEGRLPLRTVRWYLETFHRLRLSVGAIVQALHRTAAAAAPAVAAIRDRVRAAPAVNADETGWRENGVNGYLWTFATPTERYFTHGGRNKEMVDAALGAEFAGVVGCDFYAAYNHLDGPKQRCWAHLLRDIHELRLAHPADQRLARWAKAVRRIFLDAKAFSGAGERERLRAQQHFERRLLRACAPYVEDAAAPQRGLCARIQRHIEELFVFVARPEVPATNNAAERSLRHLVTSRKISGGTRSPQGTATKMALATLFGTWRARGDNPFAATRALLISP
jgi:transposase